MLCVAPILWNFNSNADRLLSPLVSGRIQDYCFRNTIRYPKLKDVVELLDILIIPGSDNGTSIPKIFEGGVLIKTVSGKVASYANKSFTVISLY